MGVGYGVDIAMRRREGRRHHSMGREFRQTKSSSCGHVKAGQGGEGAVGADASSHMRSKKRGQPRPKGDGAGLEGRRRSKSSCRWGGAGGAALNKEQLPMGWGWRGGAEARAAADGAGLEGRP
jgi:hypothetical protein